MNSICCTSHRCQLTSGRSPDACTSVTPARRRRPTLCSGGAGGCSASRLVAWRRHGLHHGTPTCRLEEHPAGSGRRAAPTPEQLAMNDRGWLVCRAVFLQVRDHLLECVQAVSSAFCTRPCAVQCCACLSKCMALFAISSISAVSCTSEASPRHQPAPVGSAQRGRARPTRVPEALEPVRPTSLPRGACWNRRERVELCSSRAAAGKTRAAWRGGRCPRAR